MFILPAVSLLLGAIVPTGIAELHRTPSDISPMEQREASFSDVSLPLHGAANGNTVMILVAEYVVSPLAAEIAQLQSDLVSEGWTVIVQSMSGGTAGDMRTLFQTTPDLEGAILVGFLPCAWFEEDYWAVEEFPCELYLMDLDGVWSDTDSNGFFDTHTGNVAPEIWVGRIDAHAMDFGSELLMLSEYLQKDHLYRTGSMAPPSRALAYMDDDWSNYTDCGLDYIYGSSGVTVVNSEAQTTAVNYLSRLSEGYEFVHLMAHSCPWGHTFKVPSGMAGTVMAPEIAQLDPNTAFLQLFSCSNARWVEAGCLGNWYLFGTDTGLLISGAAKTGSMLDFEYFYEPIGSGSCFGEAFEAWWNYQASGGFSSDERAWFYGNALLGDPTLKPSSAVAFNAAFQPQQGATDAFAVSSSIHSDCFPDADTHGSLTAAAWLTGENGRLDVAARFYDDSQDSWSQVYIVDADEYWDNAVSVCFDDSGVPWLAWSDFEYSTYSYRIKTAHGIPFENITVSVPQDGYQVSPDLAFAGRMWLTWQDWEAAGGRIMVKALEGTPFETQLSQTGAWSSSPVISEGPGGKLHAVWVDNSSAGSSVMWCFGDETGFSAPVEISSGSICHSPCLGFNQGILTAAWQSDGTGSCVEARTWDGSQWGATQQIVSTMEHIMNPVVCTDPGGNTEVLWQQGRANATGWGSILEAGVWSSPFQPVSPGGPVWNPVCTGGKVFWAGTAGGDWNIYCDNTEGVEQEASAYTEYPRILTNPVQGMLSMGLAEQAASFSGTVRILDISGRVVLESGISIQPGGNISLDCSGLPSGIYSVTVGNTCSASRFTLLH